MMVVDGEWEALARNLTGAEVVARLRAGDDLALLPVGCLEMHGPQLPLGTDTFIAEAVCRMAAARTRGTVFDTIGYSWSGVTKYSRPTISLTMEMETRFTRMVCDELARCGFRRLCVVQFHGPGIALMRLAREFFEETGIPLAFYGLLRLPDCGREECARAGAHWEASLCAAAARYLGYAADLRPDAWLPARTPPVPGAEARQRVADTGAFVGDLATSDYHHGAFRGRVDPDLGLALLYRFANRIAAAAAPLAEWRDAWADIDVKRSYRGDEWHE